MARHRPTPAVEQQRLHLAIDRGTPTAIIIGREEEVGRHPPADDPDIGFGQVAAIFAGIIMARDPVGDPGVDRQARFQPLGITGILNRSQRLDAVARGNRREGDAEIGAANVVIGRRDRGDGPAAADRVAAEAIVRGDQRAERKLGTCRRGESEQEAGQEQSPRTARAALNWRSGSAARPRRPRARASGRHQSARRRPATTRTGARAPFPTGSGASTRAGR